VHLSLQDVSTTELCYIRTEFAKRIESTHKLDTV
jgi:hypothetical protein